MDIIPAMSNEKRFAVANIQSGVIIVVAPSESYCHAYCTRSNEDFPVPRFHVIPYGEPVRTPRHPSREMSNHKVYVIDETDDTLETATQRLFSDITQPKTLVPTAKHRIQEYLKKVLTL